MRSMNIWDLASLGRQIDDIGNSASDLWTWIPHDRSLWEEHQMSQPDSPAEIMHAACNEISRLRDLLEKHGINYLEGWTPPPPEEEE
jgi:hypothetical protein